MKKKLMAALAAGALAVIPASAAMAQESTLDILVEIVDTSFEGAQVTVVHGIPGADGVNVVEASAGTLIPNFNFGQVVTTTLDAGVEYTLNVSTSDDIDDGLFDDFVITLEEGTSYAVVAHLDEGGDIALTPFVVNAGEGVSAFHTAQFPAVAIVAGGEIAADDLTNGNAAQLDLEPGTTLTDVGVAAAGSTDIALPVADELTIEEGTRALAFAVGAPAEEAPEDEVDEEAEEEVEQPTHVDSGTGGLLDTGLPVWVAALMIMGALGIAAPAVATARRRS